MAINGLGKKNEANYELTRRLSMAVVSSGMNDKLKRSFNKFFPPFDKRDDSVSIKEQANKIFSRMRENIALANASGKLKSRRGK